MQGLTHWSRDETRRPGVARAGAQTGTQATRGSGKQEAASCDGTVLVAGRVAALHAGCHPATPNNSSPSGSRLLRGFAPGLPHQAQFPWPPTRDRCNKADWQSSKAEQAIVVAQTSFLPLVAPPWPLALPLPLPSPPSVPDQKKFITPTNVADGNTATTWDDPFIIHFSHSNDHHDDRDD